MIWTQSQAMIFATVSRVFVHYNFDRMTEYVQNVRSLRSRAASEQGDRVPRGRRPRGRGELAAAVRVPLHVDGVRVCVIEVTLVL